MPTSMGGQLYTLLLKSLLKCWFVCKVKLRLSADGQEKYKAAKENYQLSEDELSRRESQGSRGRGCKLTYEDLATKLGPAWYEDKVKRFFGGKPNYPVTESEAKAVCDALGIDFDLNDYLTMEGTAPSSSNSQEVGPSVQRLDECGLNHGVDVAPVAVELEENQSRCNPIALRASASEGSIPDPFASSDFHLKVIVEESGAGKLKLLRQAPTDGAPLSCRMRFSLYQGKDAVESKELASVAGIKGDPFCFSEDDPDPLIKKISKLQVKAVEPCLRHLGDSLTPLRLHLHIMLPVAWLSGSLPEVIRRKLRRQVFFGCSGRAELAISAVTQLRSQAIKVNQILYSGGKLSSLNWATVCHETNQTEMSDQLFHPSAEVVHLNVSSLDSEADHCDLAERHALLACEQSVLFGDVRHRWECLVMIGVPLVLWWRSSTEPLSLSFKGLRRLLDGSWINLCECLELLEKVVKRQDQSGQEMQTLMEALGIFYEDPLRCPPPSPYRHPWHTSR